MDEDAPYKIAEIIIPAPQDVECSFCKEKPSTASAAVVASTSAATICSNCVAQFSFALDEIYSDAMAESIGATLH